MSLYVTYYKENSIALKCINISSALWNCCMYILILWKSIDQKSNFCLNNKLKVLRDVYELFQKILYYLFYL